MADPLGLISSTGGSQFANRPAPAPGAGGERPGPDFGQVLLDNLNQVNEKQQEATRAIEDLTTGKRSDVENVILKTQKADDAFRMLQALRNRRVDAYDELKQTRV